MKNILKYTLAALIGFSGLMTISSCSEDSLDIEQKGVKTTAEYQTADDDEVMQFLAGIYSKLHGDYAANMLCGADVSYSNIVASLTDMTDDSANGYAYTDASTSSYFANIWSYYYKVCYWCGMVIENLPNNNVASTDVKNRAVAECRAIRAYAMAYLVQLYGNPPLADHIMSGSEGNTPASESWAWIETELTEAAQSLPSKSGKDGQSAIGGRLTKEAAYAILGRVQLWEKKYDEAAKTLYNNVIATGKYELLSDFSQLNSCVSDFSSENIWEYNFDNDANFCDSQEGSFELYGFAPDVTYPYYGGKYAYHFQHYAKGANASKDLWDFYVAHDGKTSPRFQNSIQNVETITAAGCTVSFPTNTNAGYFKARNICLAGENCGTAFMLQYGMKNQIYMRYAEVLLNYAEAVANGGTNGANLTGLQALNLVRERAGLADAPSLDMDNATYGIKAERRAEFYTEGLRYIDVVRWGDAAKLFANVGKTTYTLLGANGDGTYNVSETPTGNPGWKSNKNELFPIPDSDVSGAGLTQNAGW